MAGRGRTSFQKRQKEQLRLERRQQKAARKQERKTNKSGEPEIAASDEFAPVDLEEDIVLTDLDLDPAGGLSRAPRDTETRH